MQDNGSTVSYIANRLIDYLYGPNWRLTVDLRKTLSENGKWKS